MRLPFLKPKDAAAASPPPAPPAIAADADDIESARLRARRRLVGALVLLVAGVIAFPLVFETQPRPIGAQTAVEPGAREVVAAAAPAAPKPKAVEMAPVAPPPDAGIEAAPAASAATAMTPPPAPPVAVPAPLPVPAPAPAPAPTVLPKPTVAPADAARAKALLEGAPSDTAAAAGSGRFVVQVGAYAATAPMKEVRAKVEKLGMKTYTQVIENADGKRTRLRVGPFGTRAEAEAAAAKLKAAGLPGNLLSL